MPHSGSAARPGAKRLPASLQTAGRAGALLEAAVLARPGAVFQAVP
ncbi:MAG: hypothetical protein HPY58_12510 [Firmicutes bacterium]|nr:hypothetical protein [Bacillota bacterium]